MPESDSSARSLTARIVSVYVAHNEVPARAVAGLIRDVYQALAGGRPLAAGTQQARPPLTQEPKGPQIRSVFQDHLVCMECGLHMKMLKRHLQTVHKLTPAQYRSKWDLAGDYPMVAREYAALRSTLAKESGLGKRPTTHGR